MYSDRFAVRPTKVERPHRDRPEYLRALKVFSVDSVLIVAFDFLCIRRLPRHSRGASAVKALTCHRDYFSAGAEAADFR
jgi:hypothetical protein